MESRKTLEKLSLAHSHQSESVVKKKTTASGLNIFDHNSHISFINAFLNGKQTTGTKSIAAAWSIRGWARRLGVGSSTTVLNILKGKKLPSAELANKMARSMGLPPLETEYFITLIELRRQKDSQNETIQLSLRRKIKALETLARTDGICSRRFRHVCLPQHHVLRALTTLRDFRENPDWIRERITFRMSDEEIRYAIQDLIFAGLLERDANGRLIPTAAFHDTRTLDQDENVQQYLSESLNDAKKAISGVSVSERTISNNVFSVNFNRIEEMKAFLHAFRNEFLGSFADVDENSDSVFQLNIQLFPSARPKTSVSSIDE